VVDPTEGRQARLRILLAEYERRGKEIFKLGATFERLTLMALAVLATTISVEYVPWARQLAESRILYLVAPAVFGIVIAVIEFTYANMNGLVYNHRDLEGQISLLLSEIEHDVELGKRRPVLQYETRFGRQFHSPKVGDRGIRTLLILTVSSGALAYAGMVALCYVRLQLQGWGAFFFVTFYAGLAGLLVDGLAAAVFRVKRAYLKAMELPYATARPLPWSTVILARPLDILGKSLFFFGALLIGALFVQWRDVPWQRAVLAWIFLEFFVNQSKYVLNDLHDAATDRRFHSIRANPFSQWVGAKTGRQVLYTFGVLAVAKAGLGVALAAWLVDPVVAALMATLLVLQFAYDLIKRRVKSQEVHEWLAQHTPPSNMAVRVGETSEEERIEKARRVALPDWRKGARASASWTLVSLALGTVLGVGYAIRLAIPLRLFPFSLNPSLFAGYLIWGTALGFAVIMGYWSWEGAYWAQTRADDPSVGEAMSKRRTAQLWCYRQLEQRVSRRSAFARRPAAWETVWLIVLLTAPILAAKMLRDLNNGSVAVDIAIPMAVAALAAILYWLLPVGGRAVSRSELPQLSWIGFPVLIVGLLSLIFLGPRAPYVVHVPLLVALAFAAHYTCGPWSRFDPGVYAYGLRAGVRLLCDALFVWSDG
jgi:hypothetical protein